MKNSFDSRLAPPLMHFPARAWAGMLFVAAFVLFAGRAHAVDLEEGFRCLDRDDVPCARRVADEAAADGDDSPASRLLSARTAFYEGRYQEALDHMASLEPLVPDDDESFQGQLTLFKDTVTATADFVEKSRNGVTIRYSPGVDVILVDEALDTIAAAVRNVAPLLGGAPEQPLIVEIYPSADRFIAASGLGRDAVETTGVVALSKWSRLLMTSPRALVRGYPWKDTLVHEYIHLIVAYRSYDRTPVWLQEGIARSMESGWASPLSKPLTPYDQALLARAIASDDLVTLEEMHPSMAFLPSAERAQLAFAQVKVVVEFAASKGGSDTIRRAIWAIRDGTDAREALAEAAGYTDFDAFYAEAQAYLRRLDLVERRLAVLPTVVKGDDDAYADDPLLGKRKDLAEFARLGDLLREASRPRAALVEYAKAMPDDLPASPMLANLVSRCWTDLSEPEKALSILRESVAAYPEFALTLKTIGELELRLGRPGEARASYLAAADINPYDPEVQAALALLERSAGNGADANRHDRYYRILRTGGGLETADRSTNPGNAP